MYVLLGIEVLGKNFLCGFKLRLRFRGLGLGAGVLGGLELRLP